MKRRDFLPLVAGSAALPACTRVGSTAPGGRRPGTIPHVLRYADLEDPVGLNPVITTHASTSWVASMWAAWLFRYNPNYTPVPELATVVPTTQNGLVSKDGKRIVFKLREAVWSDGVPFTSKDVAFTVGVILAPGTNVTSREGWDQIEHVETPDDRTAIFHMKGIYATYLPTFFTTGGAGPCILPEHIVRGQDPNKGPYNEKPIGIGPFVIDSWERGQSVNLSANPRYWRGLPKLQRVEYKIIPNADTVVTQLHTNELDLWVMMNPHYLDQVQGIGGLKIVRQNSPYWRHFDCNCSHPALAEIPVRKALNYAIDRETIIKKALHGVGIVNWTVVSPDSWAFDPHVEQYPFDLAKANALLDSAGWKMGPGGVRAKDGQRLHLSFALLSGDPAWQQIVELTRSTWQQIGVTFDSKTYLSSLYFAQYQDGGIVNTGKYDVCAFQWGNTPAPQDMVGLYASDQIPPAGQNSLRWINTEASDALHGSTRTLDRAEQIRLLWKAQQIIAEECPTFPIVQNVDLFPCNADLKNFRPSAPSGPFDFMMETDI